MVRVHLWEADPDLSLDLGPDPVQCASVSTHQPARSRWFAQPVGIGCLLKSPVVGILLWIQISHHQDLVLSKACPLTVGSYPLP